MPPVSPASTHGVYGSAVQTDRQVRQVLENLTRVYPESTPFHTFLTRASKITDGRANKLEFMSISDFPRTVTLASASSDTDTSIVVDDATHITESQVLFDPVTEEQILVISKSGNTLTTATRGTVGGGTPGSLAQGKALYVLGIAIEEGATRVSSVGIHPRFDHNFFQQFEMVTGITDRAEQIMHYGPNPRDLDAMEVLLEYKKRQERQYLFGWRKEISVGSSGASTHPRWICGGLLDFITNANTVYDANGAFTYQEFMDFMEDQVRVGRGSRFIGYAPLHVLNIMSRWPLQYHQADTFRTTTFGLEVTRLKGPGWTVELMRDEQFEDQEEINTWLMLVNPNHVRLHTMRGLGDRTNRGVTGPTNDGDHTKRDQITGVHTLECNLPEAHSLIKNIES